MRGTTIVIVLAVIFGGLYYSYSKALTTISGGTVPVKNYCSFLDYLLRRCSLGI